MKTFLYAFLLIALLTNCEEGETTPSQITGKNKPRVYAKTKPNHTANGFGQ